MSQLILPKHALEKNVPATRTKKSYRNPLAFWR